LAAQSEFGGRVEEDDRVVRKTVVCIFIIFTTSIVQAEASVNVPVHHWAYEALDTLNTSGLSGGSGLTTMPITRMEAARLTETAIYRIQNEEVQFSPFDEARTERAEDALDRLIEEFRPELIKLGVSTVVINEEPIRALRFKLADPVSTQTVYASLDGATDLTYENQRGFMLEDGFNSRHRLRSWAEFGDLLAIELEPVIRLSDSSQDLDIETAYVKLVLWNTAIKAGRDTLWWGPGYHGSLLLSDNAYPLDMVKISNARPFTLPGALKDAGEWDIDFFVSRLEEKRTISYAKLAGLRLAWAPFEYFSFGASRTVMFGGEGRPSYTLEDYIDLFTTLSDRELSQTDPKNADQKASIDFSLNIPWHDTPFGLCNSLKFYGEWAGEDKFAPWENEAPAYLAGIHIRDLFKSKGLDVRTEYAHTNSAWYIHGIYSSGHTYKGNILGHHTGGDAEDFLFRVSKDFVDFGEYLSRFSLAGQFDYETHGISLASPERKYELAVDGIFFLSDDKRLKLNYEYEGYRSFENISGRKIHNNIFEIEARIKF